MIQEARRNHLRICLVWFASFKNGLVSWAPLWVKKDYKRFPRARIAGGQSIEYFSVVEGYGDTTPTPMRAPMPPSCATSRRWTARAHRHLHARRERSRNVGRLPRPLAGSRESLCRPVPKPLIDYLQKHKDTLIPEFRQVWEKAGSKTSGSWEEVFGKGAATDEIFMVWSYAQYVNRVTEAAKPNTRCRRIPMGG